MEYSRLQGNDAFERVFGLSQGTDWSVARIVLWAACPPEGGAVQRNIFTLYAMHEAVLLLDANGSGGLFGFHAKAAALETAPLSATCSR